MEDPSSLPIELTAPQCTSLPASSSSPGTTGWFACEDDDRSLQQKETEVDDSGTQWESCDLHHLGTRVWEDKRWRSHLLPMEASLLALALFRRDSMPPIALALTAANLLSRPRAEVQLLRLAASPKVGRHLCYKVGFYQPETVIHRSPALLLTRCPCPDDHQIQHEVKRPLPDRAAAVAYGANLQMLNAIWKSAEESGDSDVLMAVASDALCAAIAGCHAEIVQWVLGKIISSQALFPTLSSPCSTDFIFSIFATNIPYSIAARRRWHLGLRLLQEAGAPTTVPLGISSPIAIATRAGDVKMLKCVIELGFDVKSARYYSHADGWKQEPSTYDPLIASLNNPVLTKVLLTAGADPHQAESNTLSPFEYCTGLLDEKSTFRRLMPYVARQHTFVESAMKMVVEAGKKTKYRKSDRVKEYEGWGGYRAWDCSYACWCRYREEDTYRVSEHHDSRHADLHEQRVNKGHHRKMKQ